MILGFPAWLARCTNGEIFLEEKEKRGKRMLSQKPKRDVCSEWKDGLQCQSVSRSQASKYWNTEAGILLFPTMSGEIPTMECPKHWITYQKKTAFCMHGWVRGRKRGCCQSLKQVQNWSRATAGDGPFLGISAYPWWLMAWI